MMYEVNKKELLDRNESIMKEEIIAYVKNQFSQRSKDRLMFELEWILNINFIEGNQYVEINDVSQAVEPIVKDFWWQVQDVFNQIAPIHETRLAKLSRVTPSPKVRPATSEKGDISSAKIAAKLIEGTHRSQEMRKKIKHGNAWVESIGTVLYKAVWDKNSGRIVGYKDDKRKAIIHEGDIATLVVPPFEIYPDTNYVDDISDCFSIIHARAYSVKEIENIYGVKEDGKEITVFSLNRDVRGSNIMSKTSISSMVKKDAVMVYEYWEKPSIVYPYGRFILCTDNNLLEAKNFPYRVGPNYSYEFPFVMAKCIERTGVLWGKSVVSRLIPLQRRYNVIKSRKAEYLNRAAIGQLAYEEGSIDEESIEEDGLAPGSMIPYKRGYQKPSYMEYHGLPSTFETEESNILADFNRISGVSEISRDSKAPTGVNSGIALSILQEQDDTRISLTAENLENMHIDLWKLWLRLYKQFVKAKRVLRYTGKNNLIEVLDWEASSLTSEDIYIDGSTRLSETPAQRKQMVFDLLNSGLFNDPETGVITKEGRIKIFEMLEMGNWEDYDDDDNLHIQKAQRENIKLASGLFTEPVDYDDELIHIAKHNAYRLTQEFEDLIEQSPEIAQLFEQHIAMHLASIQNKAAINQPPVEGEMQNDSEQMPNI